MYPSMNLKLIQSVVIQTKNRVKTYSIIGYIFKFKRSSHTLDRMRCV